MTIDTVTPLNRKNVDCVDITPSDSAIEEVERKGALAKSAARVLASAMTSTKNAALIEMSELLPERIKTILAANAADIEAAHSSGIPPVMLERLTLNASKLSKMSEGLLAISSLPDPIGDVLSGGTRPNGLKIVKIRVPLGVVGIIYESRPNVTIDAAALCLKSGNASILRGGTEAIRSNVALMEVISESLIAAGLPSDAVQLIESTDRAGARRLMSLNGVVDCLVPRGGAALIKSVVENASVPVIETGTGNCHIYVDTNADLKMAIEIVMNAKVQSPAVCNSAETLIIHADIAQEFLAMVAARLHDAGVEIRADARALQYLQHAVPATELDWLEEYNALILAIKTVDSLDDAIAHIDRYGTRHSEAIVTNDYEAAQVFVDRVDCAAVYVNASTRFTDGNEFGFGAEIGISNQKLHARGPMGLNELTTCKFIVRGNGQIRS